MREDHRIPGLERLLEGMHIPQERYQSGQLLPYEQRAIRCYAAIPPFLEGRYPGVVFTLMGLRGNPLLDEIPGYAMDGDGHRFDVSAQMDEEGHITLRESFYCAWRQAEMDELVEMLLLSEQIRTTRVKTKLLSAFGDEVDPQRPLEEALSVRAHLVSVMIELPVEKVTEHLLTSVANRLYRAGLVGSVRLTGLDDDGAVTDVRLSGPIREEE